MQTMVTRILQGTAVLFLTLFLPIRAQEQTSPQILIGPTAGLDLALESSRLPVYGTGVECGEFTSGRAFTPSLGMTFMLPKFFSERLGLWGTAGVNYASGRLSATPIEATRVLDEETNTLIQ